MPMARKPPRLYLRRDPKAQHRAWIIRDCGRDIRTGFREGEEAEAEQVLANYLAGSFKPRARSDAEEFGVGVIYYASVAGSDTYPVKIGYTRGKVSTRLEQMQGGNPNAILCLATERGSLALERERHRQFASYHFRGEWFMRGSALMRHIAGLTGGGIVHFENDAQGAQVEGVECPDSALQD